MTWKKLHAIVMQLEILTARINVVGYCILPLALVMSFYICTVSAVWLLRVHPGLLGNLPIEVAYSSLAGYFVGAMLATCGMLRMCEELAVQSESVMDALKAVVEAEGVVRPDGRRCRGILISRNMRRRPLRLKIWFLMTVEVGMAFDFVQSVFDNVLTGIMMVNVNVPAQLL